MGTLKSYPLSTRWMLSDDMEELRLLRSLLCWWNGPPKLRDSELMGSAAYDDGYDDAEDDMAEMRRSFPRPLMPLLEFL